MRARIQVCGAAFLSAALTMACVPVISSQGGGSQCNRADSVSDRVGDYLDSLLISKDSADVAFRNSASISGILPSQVVLVTDARTCARLASAIDHLARVGTSGRKVYAFSVGTTFAALDPSIKAGEYVQLLFYDNKMKLLKSVGVF